MEQPPRDSVRDDIISLYQYKDMRDSMNFTSFMIHLSRIFHTLRKPKVLEISKDVSTELKICLDSMFPKGVEHLKEQLYRVLFNVNQDLLRWKFLQQLVMEDPDSVLQKTFENRGLRCCTCWPSTNGNTSLNMFTFMIGILQKRNKKNTTKSETESDAESIISDEEEERNSILMSSNKKKSKPWNETIIREKYDVFITNDHERTEELIPPLSVYTGAGFAAEIKHFHIESITEKVFSTEPSSDKSFSFKTEIHKPVAYSILLIGDNKNVVFHCGLDAISNLIICLQNISKAVLKYMKRNIPMDKDGIVSEDKCHLCKQEFPRGCISVTNHDHFSGKVLGKACQGYVVLLAEVFENFRTLSMNYFELDPVHFYTTPSLTWSAGIKTTKVTLELLTDIDMYLMLESGIRGGMCLVSKRYSKANNKYLENFDNSLPSKFIISLDVNNLYGTAMGCYKLSKSEFKFLTVKEIDDFNLMSEVPTQILGIY
ncbi:uncharacterized protein CDAR_270541 [Caerostris darwini]|uniref:DNA-directed DNA polymerase n=1 Tax=Caerostris darwini TaxID=1538125 RepID=A0AAV4NGZ2_9ARAC|nr:uncharacterized protein CDAR_270541 [Caerostris darwini]